MKVYLKMLIIDLGILLTVFCITQHFAVMILVGHSVVYTYGICMNISKFSLKCVILAVFFFLLNTTYVVTMTSAISVQRSTSWAIRPTGSWSLCGSIISP